MKKIIMTASLIMVLLLGCSKPHEVKTYKYYMEHVDEASAVAKACKTTDKTDLNIQQDCSNAVQALSAQMFLNGTKTMPVYGSHGLSGF